MAWHTELVNELFDSKSMRRTLVATAAACAFYQTYYFLVYMSERGFHAFEAFGNVFGVVIRGSSRPSWWSSRSHRVILPRSGGLNNRMLGDVKCTESSDDKD